MTSPLPLDSVTLDALSAFLDGRLTQHEAVQLQKRLEAEPELRTQLRELDAVRHVLHTLPEMRPPRNLTLKAETATRPQPLRWLTFAYGFGSAFAVVAAIILFTFPQSSVELPAAQAPQPALMQSQPIEPPEAPAAADQVVSTQPNQLAAPPAPLTPEGKSFILPETSPHAETVNNATPAPACTSCPALAGGMGIENPTVEETITPETETSSFTVFLPMAQKTSAEQASQPAPLMELTPRTIASLGMTLLAIVLGILFIRKRNRG